MADIYRTGSCPLFELKFVSLRMYLPRKEVIQPHLPVRLPCYDLYKARERIHRGVLIRDY